MGYIVGRIISLILLPFTLIGEATIFLFNLLVKVITSTFGHIVSILRILCILILSLVKSLIGTVKGLYNKLIYLLKNLFGIVLDVRIRPVSVKKSRPVTIRHYKQHAYYSRLSIYSSRILFFTLGGLCSALLVFSIITVRDFKNSLPNPLLLSQRAIPITSKIYDKNDQLLYELYEDENRTFIPLSSIPPVFIQATIAIEDKNFYQHNGFSPKGIARAVYRTLYKKDLQGGSTITQQLVRSALLNRDITLSRKIKELALSIWTESKYTKDQILEMYLNQVPYGGTAWGAEAAARQYFGKSIKDVTLSESALLAGLPAAPSRFSPFGLSPDTAILRQQQVLRRMKEDGYITKTQEQQALEQKLSYIIPKTSIYAPHFVMYVKKYLEDRYGERAISLGGLQIKTTLDLSIQKQAEKIVSEKIDALAELNVSNGALLVTDPQTGYILAMVGSRDYFDKDHDGNVNITTTLQPPGSSIKVVTYATALSGPYTAATLIPDEPITFKPAGSEPYSPVNYDGKYHGIVTLRSALGNSYNIPAVRTLAALGLSKVIETGQKMGITSWSDPSRYGLSLTLGGAEVTMLDMASVYGVLANKGIRQSISPIVKVTDYQGNILEDNSNPQGLQVLDSNVAFILSDILSDNSARSNAFGANSLLTIPNQWVAVKTGTSNNKRDNWTIGFTDKYVVVVWVGNNDNTPMNPLLTSGITGAAPIWRSMMDTLLTQKPSQKPYIPLNIVKLPCRGRDEYFVKGSEPKDGCAPLPTPTGVAGETKPESLTLETR